MKRARAAQQGDFDGLCGLYALAHFLRDVPRFKDVCGEEPHERGQQAFWYLLEATDNIGLLRPLYIFEGFEDYHLIKIFRTVSENLNLRLRAELMSEWQAETGHGNFSKGLERLFVCRGKAILVTKKDHWVLGSSLEGSKIVVDDSLSSQESTTIAVSSVVEKRGLTLQVLQ